METKTDQYLSLSQLKELGWTRSLVSKFLRDPDKRMPVPGHPSWPQMKLYSMRRVKQAEESAAFRQAKNKVKGNREAAQKGLATKRQNIEEYVETVQIDVPQLEKDDLIRLARNNVLGMEIARNRVSERLEALTDECMCVNYLRHCQTQYETELGKIAGKVGAHDAYLDIREKVFDAIADKYPWLSNECWRQEKRMRDKENEPQSVY